MDKQKQDEEKYGKWDWDSYDAVGGGDDVGDVPAGLEEVARMQRAQEATGGMIQFDGPDQEEAAGLSLVVVFWFGCAFYLGPRVLFRTHGQTRTSALSCTHTHISTHLPKHTLILQLRAQPHLHPQ